VNFGRQGVLKPSKKPASPFAKISEDEDLPITIDRPQGFKKRFQTLQGAMEKEYPVDYGYFNDYVNPDDEEPADVFVGSGGPLYGRFMKGTDLTGQWQPDERKWYQKLTPDELAAVKEFFESQSPGLIREFAEFPNQATLQQDIKALMVPPIPKQASTGLMPGNPTNPYTPTTPSFSQAVKPLGKGPTLGNPYSSAAKPAQSSNWLQGMMQSAGPHNALIGLGTLLPGGAQHMKTLTQGPHEYQPSVPNRNNNLLQSDSYGGPAAPPVPQQTWQQYGQQLRTWAQDNEQVRQRMQQHNEKTPGWIRTIGSFLLGVDDYGEMPVDRHYSRHAIPTPQDRGMMIPSPISTTSQEARDSGPLQVVINRTNTRISQGLGPLPGDAMILVNYLGQQEDDQWRREYLPAM